MKATISTSLLALSLAAAIPFLAGCSRDAGIRNVGTAADTTLRPDTEVKGARIDLFDKQERTTEILAKRILKFDTKDSTMGYDVIANFFDSTGKIVSNVVGDSALIRETSNHLFIYGRVVVLTDDSTRLDTDYLHWNPDIKKIQTDAFVKVRRQGDVVTGWGMEADQRLTHLKILNQVSGTLKNAETYENKSGQ